LQEILASIIRTQLRNKRSAIAVEERRRRRILRNQKSILLSLSLSLSLVWQEGEDLRFVTKLCDLKLGDLFLPQKNNRLATKKFKGFPSS
jgi:hypothetical protein